MKGYEKCKGKMTGKGKMYIFERERKCMGKGRARGVERESKRREREGKLQRRGVGGYWKVMTGEDKRYWR